MGEAAVAMDSIRRIVQALRALSLRSQREFGVTAAQLFVLRRIAAHPGLSLAELARQTVTRESSVSEVVTRLVARGFVERRHAEDDRRRVELRLAPTGERVVAVAPETVQERLVDAFHDLPDDARRALSRGLSAWLVAAGLDHLPTSMFFEPSR
jgi:DNA-binding MarR family transcriptional regulator